MPLDTSNSLTTGLIGFARSAAEGELTGATAWTLTAVGAGLRLVTPSYDAAWDVSACTAIVKATTVSTPASSQGFLGVPGFYVANTDSFTAGLQSTTGTGLKIFAYNSAVDSSNSNASDLPTGLAIGSTAMFMVRMSANSIAVHRNGSATAERTLSIPFRTDNRKRWSIGNVNGYWTITHAAAWNRAITNAEWASYYSNPDQFVLGSSFGRFLSGSDGAGFGGILLTGRG